MRRPTFESLSQELLEAGIAPKFADRLRRELEDHYRDLEREALANERSAIAAAVEARRRLGTDEMIAHECLSRPELKSWVYRSRCVVLCLRGLCLIYLGLRAVVRGAAGCRAPLARFAAAGAAAAAVVAALLLVLELSISADRAPVPVRTLGHVQRVAAVEPPSSGGGALRGQPGAETPVGELAADVPPRREIDMPAIDRPRLSKPDVPRVAMRVRPVVALEIELRPGALPKMQAADGDLLPIVKIPPRFPVVAARRGIEGYVLIEYTVTRTGSVSDVVVVESSSEVFEQPALDAVSKFKYKPRVVDGRAVPVRGVRTRMRFVLEA